MSEPNIATRRATFDIRMYLAANQDRSPAALHGWVAGVIQAAIDEETAKHKPLVTALRELVAGAWVTKEYGSKCCRHCAAQTTFPNHYIGCPIPEANAALAPFEEKGPKP